MKNNRWDTEDDIPTSPGHRGTRSDLHHTVGSIMAESVNHRRRIEALESLVFGKKNDSDPPETHRKIVPLIKKTVTYAVLILAGIISAIKELGLLK